jgi:hypothetical protein
VTAGQRAIAGRKARNVRSLDAARTAQGHKSSVGRRSISATLARINKGRALTLADPRLNDPLRLFKLNSEAKIAIKGFNQTSWIAGLPIGGLVEMKCMKAALRGFEPRLTDSESVVLPLDERAIADLGVYLKEIRLPGAGMLGRFWFWLAAGLRWIAAVPCAIIATSEPVVRLESSNR